MTLWSSTLRGLATLRRGVPIALVCVPMVLLELDFAGPRAALVGVAIFAGFIALGPAAYRRLFLAVPAASIVHQAVRVIAFALLTVSYVMVFGSLMPLWLGVTHSILSDPVTLYSAGPLFWASSWALARDIDWEERLADARARNEALAREADRTQLLALRTHLDPHFLFNTLNAIAEWCREDPIVAERATLQLSSMLRTMLTGLSAPAWPLERELELVTQLLELHRVRDPERFASSLEASVEARAVELPPMLLLSLVENAVKHGPAAGHRGPIELRASIERGALWIELKNPGPFRGARPEGQGLSIIERRLKLAYHQRATMTHDSDGTSTTVALRLPLHVSGDSA